MDEKESPSFELINRYNVSIASLRNQLKSADTIDQLTVIASRIISLEQKIIAEKCVACKHLYNKRMLIQRKIEDLRRNLNREEQELSHINNLINVKVSGYRKKLNHKMDTLSEEYKSIVEDIGGA